MDAAEFLGITPTHNPHRWYLPVDVGIATAANFLFGGCALGASIEALERTVGRPVVWATAQYLSFANVGETMDVDVTVATHGHYTTQARVVGHVGDREILTVNAALGQRPSRWAGRWDARPDVPPPEDCPLRSNRWSAPGSLMERIEMRVAKGRQWDELGGGNGQPDGTSALWVRLPLIDLSASSLAVLGDYVPYGISQALGDWAPSNSLDNTLRIIELVPTEWVLLDIRIQGIANGFGHGLVHLWAEDGTLMATASQSAIVREPPAGT
jgi:acyl-CoA thioesterase-2